MREASIAPAAATLAWGSAGRSATVGWTVDQSYSRDRDVALNQVLNGNLLLDRVVQIDFDRRCAQGNNQAVACR